nr:hypothetical protein GCM10020092_037320 [Actinoplanes digitatis]
MKDDVYGSRIGTPPGPVLLTCATVSVYDPGASAAAGVHTSVPGTGSATVPGTAPPGPVMVIEPV